MNAIREFLKGKKTYIVAAVGIVSAVVAWSEGGIDTQALVAAIWAGIASMTIRAGVDSASAKNE